MDWKRSAIEDLRSYRSRKQSLESIPGKITALQSRFQAIKSAAMDKTPVQGGASRMEDSMLNNIVERERLKHTYRAVKRLVNLVDKGLAGLSENEKKVLDRFYVERRQGHIEQLTNELHVEQAQVYRLKDEALYKFTVSMYGLIDY